MSNKSKRAVAKSRDNASRNEPVPAQDRGIAGDARSSEQSREQETQKSKAGATARRRRPPFVL